MNVLVGVCEGVTDAVAVLEGVNVAVGVRLGLGVNVIVFVGVRDGVALGVYEGSRHTGAESLRPNGSRVSPYSS